MIRYFTAHPTISNILMMAIVVLGVFSLSNLNKESFPQIKPSKVQVTAAYPGASPADVEDGICNPLEDATDGISFLKEQSCDARDNTAIFTLEMQETGDIQIFTNDIKSAVEAINNFPDNVETPVIKQIGRTSAVANIAITAEGLTASELKTLAEYYRDSLLALPDIPIINIDGFSTHQLQLLISPKAMKKYKLSIQDIANLVEAQSFELPAGTIEGENTSYQIRFDNARKTVDELYELVLINTPNGAEIRLGDIAKVEDRFNKPEERIELNGKRAAILQVSKNIIDDTVSVADAVRAFVEKENRILPQGTRLTILNDVSISVKDRLQLLISNGWQGMLLATMILLLFFSWRYTLWIAIGLPVSFLGGLALMVVLGVSINMISMVALLMAIGILMDDAIVLSESIDHEYKKGKSPLEAAVDGTKRVVSGVFSSFLTSAFLFGSLLMMKGDTGQVLGVLPVVLLSVLSVSLIEAFLILPHHLKHSLEHTHHKSPPKWRQKFEALFNRLRNGIGHVNRVAVKFRYATIGITFAMLILSVGLMATGTVKFKAFPDTEGNTFEARILLPQGTPLSETEKIVNTMLVSLKKTNELLSKRESETLIKNIQVSYGKHADAPENGAHLATFSIDLLNTEKRNARIPRIIEQWKHDTKTKFPNVVSIQYKQVGSGPAGRAIHIRLSGNDLNELSKASWEAQNFFRGYDGVSNLLDDLRPGKPQYSIKLKPGSLSKNIDSRSIARQLRAAYQEVKITDIYKDQEAFEIIAKLDNTYHHDLRDFDNFTVYSKSGDEIPLSSVAIITEKREFARIGHINHRRTVNIYGDINAEMANTSEVMSGFKNNFLPKLSKRYPNITATIKGEAESGKETSQSILTGFGLGLFGVFLLLSMQFKNYREPLLVMINIPFAFIGAIWGHYLMGIDFTMPSMIGFVSLAGIVVNDSILLVQFVKIHIEEGLNLHEAAQKAVHDRFRAIFLTSVTTVAGMAPLLFETSSQALILVPMVASIVFGMVTSTLLLTLVLPSIYAIMEDIGFIRLASKSEPLVTDLV